MKRALIRRIEAVRRPDSIVVEYLGHSTFAIADGRSAGFQRHWLGTHFFNPPRYLALLEVIPDR